MEIHTPKAFRGWRGFLKEYRTIVIGVLTALGAEQAVEAYHHREQVRQGEEALKSNYFVVLRNVAGHGATRRGIGWGGIFDKQITQITQFKVLK
jgi:hypothetical protein